MMAGLTDVSSGKALAARPPGFLLGPLGWVAKRLVSALQGDPVLLAEVIHLDRCRMHLVALACAHRDGAITREFAETLLCGSAGKILDAVLDRRPAGLRRVVQRLPHRVIGAAGYRRLVQLLDDPAAARLLHHAVAIDDAAIKIIDEIPFGLRELVFTMQPWFGNLDSLTDGLRHLVRRGAAADFETLVVDLAQMRQPGQFAARINCIVEALPLPHSPPPVQVGRARRLDGVTEIRDLAKRWRNCLADYVWRVDGGEGAIYLWQEADWQAACWVRRRGRLGWFLDEVKGPGNVDIEPPRMEQIAEAFDGAGIPHRSVIAAVEDIVDMAGVRGLRRRARPQLQDLGDGEDSLLREF